MRTQVAIIGAGPAGLLLGHLLARHGIDAVIVERASRTYCEERIRAGVLEYQTAELLRESGAGQNLDREGLPHEGFSLRFAGGSHRIDLSALTGRNVTVYGQHAVVRDLIALRTEAGLPLHFEARDVALHDVTGAPSVTWHDAHGEHILHCDIIAGCDGFHGIARKTIPADKLTIHDRQYPFAWLGILADAKPADHELIYANHPDGFGLASMRSADVTRCYVQCAPDDDVKNWSDARIWDALHTRLGEINEGPITQRGVTAMRSFVAEPMRYGRLFLAGDAAHIVPPTGAKGMNLAVADVRVLTEALVDYFQRDDHAGIDSYSARCLDRIWKVTRFSWWMTTLLHRFPDDDTFSQRIQSAELSYVAGSVAASTALAENYVGLPFAA